MKAIWLAAICCILAACSSPPPKIDRLPEQHSQAPITIINVPPAQAPIINNVIGQPQAQYQPPQYQPPPVYVQPAPEYYPPRVYVPEGYVQDYTATYNQPWRGPVVVAPSLYFNYRRGRINASSWW